MTRRGLLSLFRLAPAAAVLPFVPAPPAVYTFYEFPFADEAAHRIVSQWESGPYDVGMQWPPNEIAYMHARSSYGQA